MAAQQLYFTGTPKSQKLHRRQKRAGRQVVSWLCSLRTRGETGFERSPSSRKLARHRFLSPNPPVQRRYYKTRHSEEYRLCRRSIRSVYGSLTSELLRRRLRTTTAAATNYLLLFTTRQILWTDYIQLRYLVSCGSLTCLSRCSFLITCCVAEKVSSAWRFNAEGCFVWFSFYWKLRLFFCFFVF